MEIHLFALGALQQAYFFPLPLPLLHQTLLATFVFHQQNQALLNLIVIQTFFTSLIKK